MLNIEIYDAFLDANASEEKARAAAKSIPPTDQLATKLDLKNNTSRLENKITKIETEVKMLKWMIATMGPGMTAIIIGVLKFL